MNKRIPFLIAGFIALGVSFAQIRPKNVVDEVIWVVGDSPILISDVEGFRVNAEAGGQTFKDPYAEIPEQLAIQKLFLHQAELDSITVSDEQAKMMADYRLEENIRRYGSKEALEAAYHKTIPQIREILMQSAREYFLTQGVQKKLTSNITVTPAEVRSAIAKLPQDSLPMIPTQVEVEILTQRPTVDREEVERIENRLREFARRVNSGETSFAVLARLYSQDGSARNGGELGLSGRGQWVPEFANVAFSLTDPKKVSKIVRTEFGFHILQLIEKQGDKVNVRHILLKPEIKEGEYERLTSRLDSIASDIKAGKFSFEDAAQQLSDDKDTRNNKGLMVAQDESTGALTARFQMKSLPQDIAKVVDTMKVGEVSQAFRMMDEKTGQEICAIVKLKDRIESHRANITDDFQVLKSMILQKRQNEALQKWIAEKIKTTYTRINPEWRNHTFQHEGWIK